MTSPTRTKIVVVAEDEWLLRATAVDALTQAGFEVLEAGHARDALRLLEAQADGVHALFTDIHMPGGMDGLQLAHHTRKHWPWIALLIASGQANPCGAELPAGSRFLAKPYEPAHAVRHLLEMAELR